MSEADPALETIERLYGPSPNLAARAIHVAAVWEASASTRRFLNIGPGSPESGTDRFILELARARADAVLTTGAILRAEPSTTHAIETPSLRAFRREVLGKPAPPVSVVLTSGRGLDPGHPVLSSEGGALLLVPERARLPARLDLPVLRASELDAVRAVALMLERFGTVALEVGPSVSAALYEADPVGIDELLLSVYLEPRLAPRYRGGRFPAPDVVARSLSLAAVPRVERESSGRWRFERYLRPRPA